MHDRMTADIPANLGGWCFGRNGCNPIRSVEVSHIHHGEELGGLAVIEGISLSRGVRLANSGFQIPAEAMDELAEKWVAHRKIEANVREHTYTLEYISIDPSNGDPGDCKILSVRDV